MGKFLYTEYFNFNFTSTKLLASYDVASKRDFHPNNFSPIF